MPRLSRPRFVLVLLTTGWLGVASGARAAGPWGAAQWVWDTPAGANGSNDEPRYLRYSFELPAAPAKAEIVVSVDNVYELRVNGQKIGGHGEWSDPKHWDVAKQLRPGKNVVALVARNQGSAAGAIVWGQITLADKKTVELASGPKSRSVAAPIDGWDQADFDDSAWAAAAVLGPSNMGPWNLGGGGGGGGQGPKDGGTPPPKDFQDADKELADFIVSPDFKVELMAAEPLVVNPVSLALDEKGRIYYGESHTYRWGPQGSPYPKPTNPVVMLKPLADGKGYERVVVAEGFDDPVMGILVQGGKLWCASTQFLYLFDIDDDGHTSNRQTMLVDKDKPWNPFGMFVLEAGPDGQFYLSIGNHNMDIGGPNNRVTSRGGAGIVVRMKPDGRDLERLVQGLRVPYSFEYDPFGQLWVLSNGEGNPNRFVARDRGSRLPLLQPPQRRRHLAGRQSSACAPLLRAAGRREYAALALLRRGLPALVARQPVTGELGPARVSLGQSHDLPLRARHPGQHRRHAKLADQLRPAFPPHRHPAGPRRQYAGGRLVRPRRRKRQDRPHLESQLHRQRTDRQTLGAQCRGVVRSGPGGRRLGSADHLERERAMQTLAARGPDAISLLAKTAKSSNPLAGAGRSGL